MEILCEMKKGVGFNLRCPIPGHKNSPLITICTDEDCD